MGFGCRPFTACKGCPLTQHSASRNSQPRASRHLQAWHKGEGCPHPVSQKLPFSVIETRAVTGVPSANAPDAIAATALSRLSPSCSFFALPPEISLGCREKQVSIKPLPPTPMDLVVFMSRAKGTRCSRGAAQTPPPSFLSKKRWHREELMLLNTNGAGGSCWAHPFHGELSRPP